MAVEKIFLDFSIDSIDRGKLMTVESLHQESRNVFLYFTAIYKGNSLSIFWHLINGREDSCIYLYGKDHGLAN
jgi:hypothetical protein